MTDASAGREDTPLNLPELEKRQKIAGLGGGEQPLSPDFLKPSAAQIHSAELQEPPLVRLSREVC